VVVGYLATTLYKIYRKVKQLIFKIGQFFGEDIDKS